MYLVLGGLEDPLCERVTRSLSAKGLDVRHIANPMGEHCRFVWRLDTYNSTSRLIWEDGTATSADEIQGVLVRRPGQISGSWEAEDLAYIDLETQAALLGWIWSLDCRVVNRYPASLWRNSDQCPIFWRRMLMNCGIQPVESVLTNLDEKELSSGGNERVRLIYTPLNSQPWPLLISEEAQPGDAAVFDCVPQRLICFCDEWEDLQLVCVVGSNVIWDAASVRPPDVDQFEAAVVSFSKISGLDLIELAVISTPEGIRLFSVNSYPNLEDFAERTRDEIVTSVVRLLAENFSKGSWRED
jgi:hypothetical protein